MSTLLLVRHANTDAVGNYIAGTAAGTPLNADGQAQVQTLVSRLRHVELSEVVCSPMTRARQTAGPIADSHGLGIVEVAAFLEYEFGGWTGQTFAAMDGDERWRHFNAVRSITRPPGGELMLDVQARSVAASIEVARRHPRGRIVIVSHGDVIRALVMYFLGIPIDFVHRVEIGPARISIVTLAEGHAPLVHQINGDTVPAGV